MNRPEEEPRQPAPLVLRLEAFARELERHEHGLWSKGPVAAAHHVESARRALRLAIDVLQGDS